MATRIGYAGPIAAARFLPKGRADTIGVLFTAELTVAMRDPAAVAFLEGLSVVYEARRRVFCCSRTPPVRTVSERRWLPMPWLTVSSSIRSPITIRSCLPC